MKATWLILLLFSILMVGVSRSAPTAGKGNLEKMLTHIHQASNHFEHQGYLTVAREIASSRDIKDNCIKSINEFIEILTKNNFTNGNDWSLSMIDSTALIPNGILTGSMYHLGHFDECLAITHPKDDFIGQHCMLQIKLPDELDDIVLHYGICVPSSCSVDDINAALTYVPVLKASTDPKDCWTKEHRTLDSGSLVVVAILAAIVAISLCCTIGHLFGVWVPSKETPHAFTQSFSLVTNVQNLFKIFTGSGQLEALHGLRTISMAWVVLGHTYENVAVQPTVNLLDMEEFIDSVNHVLIWNGILSVDTFFFLSGLLVAFVFFREVDRKGCFDVPLSYIHRYLRLTPPYAVVIVIMATIFPYFGKGPMWYSSYSYAYDSCTQNWWTSILYINNYYEPLKRCTGPAWYLSVDMQLFWLSPLFLFPVFLWPKLGTVYLGLVTLASAFLPFGLDLNKDYKYSVELGATRQFEDDYVPTHMRASPWLVGAMLGVFLCYLKQQKRTIRLSKISVAAGWAFSTVTCLGCLYGVVRFLHGAEASRADVAAYLAFSRIGWALGLAWIVFACVNGYGGPVNSFLSLGIFQPLGKLTFSVYLIHVSLHNYRTGLMKTNAYIGDLETAYYFIGDYVLSNILAFLLYVFVEAPVGSLDKNYLNKIKILPLPRQIPKKRNRDENA